MKIPYLILILTILVTSSHAQVTGFQKNDFTIGGNFGVGTFKDGNTKTTPYEVGLSFGLFIKQHSRLALSFGTSSISDLTDNFSIEGGYRYYFTPAKRFSLFGQMVVGYAEGESPDNKSNTVYSRISPGLSYFIRKNIILESTFGGLGFESTQNGKSSDKRAQRFSLGLDLSRISFGILIRRS